MRRGSKAARNSSIPAVKRTSNLSVNRFSSGVAVHVHAAGKRGVFGQANQNVQIRRTAMVQTHQPGQAGFRSVLPEGIEGDIE
jgi:hypothetical protein